MSALGTLAYETLRDRRMDADDIYYLSDDETAPDRRGAPSLAALQSAIQTWTIDGVQPSAVTLYLVGDGEAEGIRCANGDLITPTPIGQWLDWPQATGATDATIIVESHYSGVFASLGSAAPRRLVLTSTSDSAATVFGPAAWTSFGRWFWGGIGSGESVRQAFATALVTARAMAITPTFHLDDNGDGAYSPKVDGYVAQNVSLGAAFVTGDDPPTINAVCASQYVAEGGTALLWADNITVPDATTLVTVWAEVTPADDEAARDEAAAFVPLREEPSTGRYEGVFSDFATTGLYVAYIYAGDPDEPAATSAPVPVQLYYGSTRPDVDDSELAGAGALEIDGATVDGDLAVGDITGYWRFDGVNGERLSFGISNIDAGRDLKIRLVDGAGTELLSVDDWGDGFAEAIWAWEPPADSAYYLEVSRDTSVDRATFELSAYRELPSGGDAFEDDDVVTRARFVPLVDGAVSEHSFHDAGDVDWATFIAYAGISYTVQVIDEGVNADVSVSLYDVDGTTLLATADNSQGSGEQIDWVAPADGQYFVQARHASAGVFGSGATYSLRVFDTIGSASGVLTGVLKDALDTPLAGRIDFSDGHYLITPNGYYVLLVYPGDYTAIGTVAAYDAVEEAFSVGALEAVRLDFSFGAAASLDVDKSGSVDATDLLLCYRQLSGHTLVKSGEALPDGETDETVTARIEKLLEVATNGYALLDVDRDGATDFRDIVLLARRLSDLDLLPAGADLPAGVSEAAAKSRTDELLAK
jgi:hypothetical protein